MQRDLQLGDRHVVYADPDGWVMAHTDAERANQLMLSLEECPVHCWALDLCVGSYSHFFPQTGWYQIEWPFPPKGLPL